MMKSEQQQQQQRWSEVDVQPLGNVSPFADPNWYHTFHSPYYTDSHRRLQKHVRAYFDKEILPYCEDWEREGLVPDEVMQRHAKLGYVAAGIYPPPSDFMGNIQLPDGISPRDWDAFHDMILIDEVARCGYLGVIWGLTCGNAIGCPPLINYGTHEQKEKFLPDILSGKKRTCLAVTEPDAGSDVAGITTTAEKSDDGKCYIVNGSKKWITNGIWADYCTAAVRTGGNGAKGISALILPLDLPGVERRKIQNSGVNASGSTYIEFDNVQVPVENLLGKENEGFKIVMSSKPFPSFDYMG